MTVTAQSVVRRVVNILQDATSVRWPLEEIVRALNDGQDVILTYRPDLLATTVNLTCVAGTRQSLPAGGTKLLNVFRNNSTASKAPVRLALRDMLDAQVPGWHSMTQSAVIQHFMLDEREPTVFWVYPPATTAAKLDVLYAATATRVTEPAAGAQLPASAATDVSAPAIVIGNLTIPDELAPALQDYILHRMFLKQSQYSGDLQRSTAHLQSFAMATGIELKGRLASGPAANSKFNPAFPPMAQHGQ